MNRITKIITAITLVISSGLLVALSTQTSPLKAREKIQAQDTSLPKHFCLVKGPLRKPEPLTETIADRNFVWDKKVINVYFWESDDWGVFNKILQVASEWTPYSGIKFKRVFTRGESDIRISVKSEGFWSYIGSYAQKISKDSITLSLDRIYLPQNQSRFRNVILHEFGHALGLIHELQHPDLVIPWKKKELFKYFLDTYNVDSNWVKEQVIEKYNSVTGIYCSPDPNSIMIYAIPEGLTENNAFVADWPDSLSELDKKYIGPICKHKKCETHLNR